MARRNQTVEEPTVDEFDAETEQDEADEVDLLEQLSWEEPPARTRAPRTGKWAKVLDTLREHEGQWARIAVKPSAGTAAALAGNLRSGTLAGAEKGEFQATSRRLDMTDEDGNDLYGVFACYDPSAAESDEADEADEVVDDTNEYSDEDYSEDE
jgi:hypothetical protein